jgi:gliding motility-associated-like protein
MLQRLTGLLLIIALGGSTALAQGISNKGKEFWVSYGHHQFMETGSNSQEMVIYLSADDQPATVTVTIDSSGNSFTPIWKRTYIIPANTVISTETIPKSGTYDARLYSVPPSFGGTGGEGTFRKKGIHIESDVPIVAYAHIYGSVSSGATMLLPIDSWGYSYTTLNSQQVDAGGPGYSWVYVIAKNDYTRIRITPSVDTRLGKPANVPVDTTLMKGQVFQIIGVSDGGGNGNQFSGTTVKAIPNATGQCFPIAVFAGSSRTRGESVPCGTGSGRDNDMQQCFPDQTWGKRYLTAPPSQGSSSSFTPSVFQTTVYKVAVKDPTTVVKKNGVPLTGLILNKYYQFFSNTADYIEADKPIMIAQFMSGGSGCNTGGAGDPEMMYLSPIEQGIKKVGFYRNNLETIYCNYITIVLPTNGLNSLKIDGIPFSSINPAVRHSYTHPNLAGYTVVVKGWNATQAQGIVESDSAFTGITYGLGAAESYGYNIGAYLNNLNGISDIHNVPDTTANTSHNFNCLGTPVQLSMLMRYIPTQQVWQISSLGSKISPNADVTLINPSFVDTPKINGIKYYKYTLPGNYIFNDTGIFTIPVYSTSPAIENCNSTEKLDFSITVKGKPKAGFTISHTGCIKDTLIFTGPSVSVVNSYNINSWKYTFGNGDTSIIKDPHYIYPATGTYTVNLNYITTEGCTADTALPVTIHPRPTATFGISPGSPVCQGSTVTFSDTSLYTGSSPISTWYWDLGTGTFTGVANNSNQSQAYNTPNPYNIRHFVKVSDLCMSDTALKVLTVNAKARVDSLTYPTTCLAPSGVANFTVGSDDQGGAPILSYGWNFGDPASGGNNTSNAQNTNHTYANEGTYTVVLTFTTALCTGDTTFQVTIKKRATLSWTAPFSPVCRNAAPVSVANGAATGATGTGTYFDVTGATTSAGMFNPATAGIGTHAIGFAFTTTGGCPDTIYQNIVVNAGAPKPVVTTPVNYCQGDAAAPLIATADPGNTLKWYTNPSLTGGSTSVPPVSTAAAGTFYFYVTQVPGSGCEGDSSIITVNVSPSISNNTIGSDQTICSGTPAAMLDITANVSGGTGTYTYQWQSSPDNTSWSNIPGATGVSYSPGAITSTTYYRKIVFSGLCSSTSNVVTVNVVPATTNYNISANQTICSGVTPVPLDGQTPPGSGFVYSWESSPDGTTWTATGGTGEDYSPGPLTATTHFRRKVVNGPCSAVSNVVIITVTPYADGSLTAPSNICQPNSADITFVATAGTAPFGISYTVTNPSGSSTTYNPTGLANNAVIPVIAPGSAPGTYTITLNSITNSNGCVKSTGFTPVTIVVTATPAVTINASPASTICEGTTLTLTANGATTYAWSGPALSGTTGSSVTANPTANATYDVTGTTNGCTGTQSISITVNPKPAKPAVVTPVTYCQNDGPVALVATPAAGHTLTWYTNASVTGGSSTPPPVNTNTAGTFLYYVNQTNSGNCTGDTSIITVTVQPSISNNTISADQTLCAGTAAAGLTGAALSGGNGTYTYQWEQSTDGGSNWTNASGGTSATLNPGTLATTTKFRRIVHSGLCSNTSNEVTITIVPAITNYNIAASQTICEGDTPAPLTGGTPPGPGTFVYSWESSPDGTTWTTITGATGVNYPPPALTTTTYYRRKTVNGPCSVTSNVVQITVNPLANGSISGPAGICQYNPGSVTFTSTTGTAPFTVQLTITNPSGGVSTITQSVSSGGTIPVIPVNSAPGTYNIALTSLTNSNGCVRTGLNSVSILVTATPLLNITVTPGAAICQGTSATLNVTGAATYTWTGTGLNTNTGPTVIASPATPNSYNYDVTGSTNGCTANASQVIVVNPRPGKPAVVTPVSYCQLGPSNPLQATATGGNTLNFYTNPALTGGTTTPPPPSTTNAGTFYYYVTQTNSFACESDSSTITIVVNPGISGNTISGGETICQGGTPATPITGTGTLSGGNGSYTYQWQQSTDGGANWTTISGATGANYSPGSLSTTTQFRRLVTSSLCGSISNVITETVFAGLANYNIAAAQTICEGTSPVPLDGQTTTGSGTLTYTWQQSADGVNWTDIPSSNIEDYPPPVLNASTWYRRKVTNGPCTAFSNEIKITVNPLAVGTITAVAAICEYDSAKVSFNASVGTAPFTVSLTITNPAGGSTTKTQTVASGDSILVIPVNSAPGNYTINFTSITGSNGCIRTTGLGSGVSITVKPTPAVSAAPVIICEGDSASLTAAGATTYAWSGPNLGGTTGSQVKAAPTSNATYTVVGTTNGCSASTTTTVTVNPRPVINIGIADNNICLNEQGIFSVQSSSIASGSIQNYYWDFDNGTTLVNPGSVNTTPPQSYSTHRLYVIKLYAISDKNCTSATDTAHLVVNPMPVADFQAPAFVCLPDNTATFQNQSSIADGTTMTYTWDFGDPASGTYNSSTATHGSHTYPDSSSYPVTLSVISSQGCSAQVSKDFDAFFRKPIAKFGVTPDTLCQGIQNVFTDSSFASGSAIASRTWVFGDGSSLQDSLNARKVYSRPGNYQITLTVQNTQGCTAEVSKNVLVYLQPVIDAGPSFVVPAGTTVTLNASANSNSIQFAWTSPTGSVLSNPSILRPRYLADQDAKFIITATGQGNCKASDSLTVKVLRQIGIPNAFSPNGDGINDKWNITHLSDYPSCVVEVFNRYGQPVFRSFGYTQPWDGTFNGKPLPVGTYYYIIEPKNGFPRITGYVVIVK